MTSTIHMPVPSACILSAIHVTEPEPKHLLLCSSSLLSLSFLELPGSLGFWVIIPSHLTCTGVWDRDLARLELPFI
jgi:hypothetical protein